MRKLKAFTWGYYGWGSASKHFVRAVDSLERKRGFLPPVFVDLRIARKGRAANFQDNIFEGIVGSQRYVWERRLGNKRILSKKGKRIQIAEPTAASDLLDRIVELQKRGRRVIMFCSCREPLLNSGDGQPSCHRVVVAGLLLKEARKRGMPVELSEWPGETPVSLRLKASDSQKKALADGARYIPIGSVDARMPSMAVLGWGSNVHFETPEESWTVVTGPAYVRKDQWRLEVIDETFTGKGAKTSARKFGDSFLKTGYGPRSIRRIGNSNHPCGASLPTTASLR
jgi:hypothetical protein